MSKVNKPFDDQLAAGEGYLNLTRSRLTQGDYSVALDYLQTTIEQLKALEITLQTIVQNERGSE